MANRVLSVTCRTNPDLDLLICGDDTRFVMVTSYKSRPNGRKFMSAPCGGREFWANQYDAIAHADRPAVRKFLGLK
jgi:hypothetical protein